MAEASASTTEPKVHGYVLDRASWVRRADISLRAHYPNLVTRIFEIAPHQFVIVFDKSLQDTAQIDFEDIRPITLQAKISNEVPVNFIREIQPLQDDQLAHKFPAAQSPPRPCGLRRREHDPAGFLTLRLVGHGAVPTGNHQEARFEFNIAVVENLEFERRAFLPRVS